MMSIGSVWYGVINSAVRCGRAGVVYDVVRGLISILSENVESHTHPILGGEVICVNVEGRQSIVYLTAMWRRINSR